ncbi:outer envelope protein [Undibacterium sp. Ren11W]|uniref:outer envelope protein n=1 Tax=Undibacterium sp. Ren11W TaxID=3413045 RepID=UPI003BF3B9F3
MSRNLSQNISAVKHLCLAIAMISGSAAQASDWSDTSINYRYIAKESGFITDAAGNKVDVAKNIVSLEHISGYKYGSNYFNVDILKSDSNDPANGSTAGAQEVFAIYRHNLNLGAVTGSSMKFGPIKEIALTAGFNAGAKNNANAAQPLAFVFGPTLQFALPAGFLNVGLQAYKETNNSKFDGGKQDFDMAAQLNVVWGVPFHAGIPANFKGLLVVTGPKGNGKAAGMETTTETLLDALVMFDVGSLGGKKDTFYAGVGYRYWNNKFGNDESLSAGNKAGHVSAPFLQLEAHF